MKSFPTHFSEVLLDEYHLKTKKNNQYSLRAFARDLGISPTTLSHIFNKKSPISLKLASMIAENLNLGDEEKEFFMALVEANCVTTEEEKRMASLKLYQFETKYNSLDVELFKMIQDWYHLAIVELSAMSGFDESPSAIAKRLSISEKEASEALIRLLRLGVLERVEGKISPSNEFMIVISKAPSEAVKSFQIQIIQKLMSALKDQPRETRDMASIIMRVRRDDIDFVKESLKNFRRELSARLQDGEGQDSVYCLTTSFFRLDTPSSP